MTQNLFPEYKDNTNVEVLVCAILLGAAIAVIFAYDRGSKGVKIFDNGLKIIVGLIVLSFLGVVVKMSVSGNMPWREIASGFVPDLSLLSEPSSKYEAFLAATGEYAEFWKGKIVGLQRDVMVSAAATAVGINMTFFMPFVLLRRRWGREHRGLARFDLWTALLIPYVVATSCVVIAAGSQFNIKPESAYKDEDIHSIVTKAKSMKPGDSVTVHCPPNGDLRSVYGSNPYTGSTSICSAGVHAGKITTAKGGTVTLKVGGPLKKVEGTEANGVKSNASSFPGKKSYTIQ